MIDQEALVRSTYQASAATWPFTAITTILFGMRAVSRLHIQKDALGWDDLVISISWALDITRAAVFQKAFTSTRQINPADQLGTVPTAAFWCIFADAWAFLSIELPKLGVGILIIRLFRPQRWLKLSIIIHCITLNILAVVGFVITFAQCSPVAGQWNPFLYPQTSCWNRSVQIIYSCTLSGISAFTNIAFAVYPGFMIWGLQMPTRKKLNTMALMGLGLAAFAFAVVKLVSLTSLLGNPDVYTLLYNGIFIGIWNSIENEFVLSAACLPAVPPFFRACKLSGKAIITVLDRSTYPTSFKLSGRSSKQDENLRIELAVNGELPGTGGSKNTSKALDSE